MGEDVESVLAQLYARADHDMAIAERGIVYVDEIDKVKKMVHSGLNYVMTLSILTHSVYLTND